MKNKLEYIWLDGTEPTAQLRSKTKIITEFDKTVSGPSGCPVWGFDGSSTNQAPGNNSDCVLKPVKLYNNPMGEHNSYLVLCEVWNVDGTPHKTNTRYKLQELCNINDYIKEWVGFEQEYTLYDKDTDRPLGWPYEGEPAPQGDYYCGRNVGEHIVKEHINRCIEADISICGTNAEVMLGQWEYQVFGRGAKKASDNAWMARYILYRTAEKFGVDVNIQAKPIKGDWNGNGMHTNFSNTKMREEGGEEYIRDVCKRFEPVHKEHIVEYGSKNDERLTGLHETQHIDTFSYGVSDRGASIRIPMAMEQNGWKGYLEDRRPSGNADPYRVVNRILTTMES